MWFSWHEPLPYEKPKIGSPQAVGNKLGEKARELFPGGVLVEEQPWEHNAAIERTKKLIEDKNTSAIFEAAFEFNNIRIRCDIFERLPKNQWAMHEVKSSKSYKPSHLHDLAVQTYVAQGCSLKIKSVGIIHLNVKYIRENNRINWERLFLRTELTDQVDKMLPEVTQNIPVLQDVLEQPLAPKIELSLKCAKCDFFGRCSVDKPDDWILYLPGIREKKFNSLLDQGVEAISDIPEGFDLSVSQGRVRDAIISNQEFISDNLGDELAAINPPAYYLDFETISPAVPLYPETSPFQMIPFQWSIHHLTKSGKLTHYEYLAVGNYDPRKELAEKLIDALGNSDQPIVVYSSYEERVIKELKLQFPKLGDPLQRLIDRLADLLKIIRQHYYHPDFNSSFSIKAVGPALVKDLGYDKLGHVANGLVAAGVFEMMAAGELGLNSDEKELRHALLEYCKIDSLSMVKVYQALADRITKKVLC